VLKTNKALGKKLSQCLCSDLTRDLNKSLRALTFALAMPFALGDKLQLVLLVSPLSDKALEISRVHNRKHYHILGLMDTHVCI